MSKIKKWDQFRTESHNFDDPEYATEEWGKSSPKIEEEDLESKDDTKVHMKHCNQGDYVDSCKYGDENCPALNK